MPTIFNRAKLISGKNDRIDFGNYNIELVMEYESLYGISQVNKVSK